MGRPAAGLCLPDGERGVSRLLRPPCKAGRCVLFTAGACGCCVPRGSRCASLTRTTPVSTMLSFLRRCRISCRMAAVCSPPAPWYGRAARSRFAGRELVRLVGNHFAGGRVGGISCRTAKSASGPSTTTRKFIVRRRCFLSIPRANGDVCIVIYIKKEVPERTRGDWKGTWRSPPG